MKQQRKGAAFWLSLKVKLDWVGCSGVQFYGSLNKIVSVMASLSALALPHRDGMVTQFSWGVTFYGDVDC